MSLNDMPNDGALASTNTVSEKDGYSSALVKIRSIFPKELEGNRKHATLFAEVLQVNDSNGVIETNKEKSGWVKIEMDENLGGMAKKEEGGVRNLQTYRDDENKFDGSIVRLEKISFRQDKDLHGDGTEFKYGGVFPNDVLYAQTGTVMKVIENGRAEEERSTASVAGLGFKEEEQTVSGDPVIVIATKEGVSRIPVVPIGQDADRDQVAARSKRLDDSLVIFEQNGELAMKAFVPVYKRDDMQNTKSIGDLEKNNDYHTFTRLLGNLSGSCAVVCGKETAITASALITATLQPIKEQSKAKDQRMKEIQRVLGSAGQIEQDPSKTKIIPLQEMTLNRVNMVSLVKAYSEYCKEPVHGKVEWDRFVGKIKDIPEIKSAVEMNLAAKRQPEKTQSANEHLVAIR